MGRRVYTRLADFASPGFIQWDGRGSIPNGAEPFVRGCILQSCLGTWVCEAVADPFGDLLARRYEDTSNGTHVFVVNESPYASGGVYWFTVFANNDPAPVNKFLRDLGLPADVRESYIVQQTL